MTAYQRDQAYYIAPGNDIDHNAVVTLNIGKLVLNIPIDDLLIPGEFLWMNDGPQGVKALALMAAPNYMLGDALFRNAYAILDTEQKSVPCPGGSRC